jgi:hypothetical protein
MDSKLLRSYIKSIIIREIYDLSLENEKKKGQYYV